MALDLSNVSLLGYNVQNQFLGDNTINHRKIITLDIQGYIDDGKKEGNTGGVVETFRKINQQIAGAQDYWENDIIINGVSFGRGRIISLSFDSDIGTTTDMIRYATYTATIETYKVGDLFIPEINKENAASTSQDYHFTSNLENIYPEYLNSWSEKLETKQERDGSTNATFTVNVDMISGDYGSCKANPIYLAKILANATVGNSQMEYLEGAFGEMDVLWGSDRTAWIFQQPEQQWNEDYDLVNYNFTFSKRAHVYGYSAAGDGPADDVSRQGMVYTMKSHRSIQKDELGFISVTERADIKSHVGDWYSLTGAFDKQLRIESPARCRATFDKFTAGWTDVDSPFRYHATQYNLGSQGSIGGQYVADPVSIGRNFDSGSNTASYTVTYSNRSGIYQKAMNEYTNSLSMDSNGIIKVSTNGTITTREGKHTDWSTLSAGIDTSSCGGSYPGYAGGGPGGMHNPIDTYINIALADVSHLVAQFDDYTKGDEFFAWAGGKAAVIPYESKRISFPMYGKKISYSYVHTSDPSFWPSNGNWAGGNVKKMNVKISDAAPSAMVKPYAVPNRGDAGEIIHNLFLTDIGTRSIEIEAQQNRACGYSYITGLENSNNVGNDLVADGTFNGAPTLYNFTPALNFMSNEALLMAYQAPSQLDGVNDMWIDGISYNINSQGSLGLTMDLKYTSNRSKLHGDWGEITDVSNYKQSNKK